MHSSSLPTGPFRLAIPGRRDEIHCGDLPAVATAYIRLSHQRRRAMPVGTIRRLGDKEASLFISSNARIWRDNPASRDWKPGAEPLYDHFAAQAAPAPVGDEAGAIDPLVAFEGWYRARTEPARGPAGWTPETTLHEDYRKFATVVEPDAEPMDTEAFARAMAGTHAQNGKRMVQLIDSAHEELKTCWSRALLRPIRVAA